MSSIGVLQVRPEHTQASPLNVAAGNVSLVGEATFTIQNVGHSDVWCRLKNTNAATSTTWARAVPGHHALLSIDGTADDALTLDLYSAGQSYRYIPIHNTTAEPVSYIGRVEVTRHGN